jgi:RNA polymerase sigma-70 factor (ECF subfamily)
MNSAFQWSDADSVDRYRLVKLCARLSGNPDAAEDLAQQTLLEAWLHEHNLRDPSRRDQWLNGVARNVCRRWARTRSRESWIVLGPVEDTPGQDDVEMELERDELADLLDRALELLPVDARALLIAHYIEGLPQTEIARRLGVQPGTIAVRLHRGRFALRRVLSSDFKDHASTYGLPADPDVGFVPTQAWCFRCGAHRIDARIDVETGELSLRCKACCKHEAALLEQSFLPGLVTGTPKFRSAYERTMRFYQQRYWPALRDRIASCLQCGATTPVRDTGPFDYDCEFPLQLPGEHGVYMQCPACGAVYNEPLRLPVFGMPEVQAFWRAHPRLRLRPEAPTTFNGRPAFTMGADDVTTGAAIEVICSAEDYSVLIMRTTPPAITVNHLPSPRSRNMFLPAAP